MKVMMNQWKVILRKKGHLLTHFFLVEDDKLSFFKRFFRLNILGGFWLIRVLFDIGKAILCTHHKSKFVEINNKLITIK